MTSGLPDGAVIEGAAVVLIVVGPAIGSSSEQIRNRSPARTRAQSGPSERRTALRTTLVHQAAQKVPATHAALLRFSAPPSADSQYGEGERKETNAGSDTQDLQRNRTCWRAKQGTPAQQSVSTPRGGSPTLHVGRKILQCVLAREGVSESLGTRGDGVENRAVGDAAWGLPFLLALELLREDLHSTLGRSMVSPHARGL